jgi:hypothetical protein
LRSKSGSLAMLAAMRRASSRVKAPALKHIRTQTFAGPGVLQADFRPLS